jgi:hypothetical protein
VKKALIWTLAIIGAVIALAVVMQEARLLEEDPELEAEDIEPQDPDPPPERDPGEPAPEPEPEPVAQQAGFEVTSVSTDTGDCLFGSQEGECHHLEVNVQASDEEDFSLNMFYWEALDNQGGVYSAPWVEGPDAVAAGTERTVILSFDVDEGTQLTELRYEEWFEPELSAPIPDY